MPILQRVKVDNVLTNVALSFGPEGYIADDVLPPVGVGKEDGIFYTFDKSRFYTPDALRAPRTLFKRLDWDTAKDSYHAEQYGLESLIDDRERTNSGLPFDLDETSTEVLTENLLNNREKRVANLVLSTTNVTQTTTLVGAAQWSDASGGDPIGVANTGNGVIRSSTGMLFNSVVLGWSVWQKLKTNAALKAAMAEGETLTLERLKAFWEVDNIYIGRVLTATNKKGQTVTLGDVWGKHVLFFYKNPGRPALRRPSFGYQLRVQDLRTTRWRQEEITCDVIRVDEIGAEKLTAPTLGYLIRNAVA